MPPPGIRSTVRSFLLENLSVCSLEAIEIIVYYLQCPAGSSDRVLAAQLMWLKRARNVVDQQLVLTAKFWLLVRHVTFVPDQT